MNERRGKVWFVGAGPGAPDLLTVRAQRVLQEADCVFYADSLVHPEALQICRAGIPIEGTSGMPLESYLPRMAEAAQRGETVARVHSGDPSIYGAILEQIAALEAEGVAYEIVPGVSSAFAAAAALGVELTIPGGTQTVILGRAPGRTGTPEREAIPLLASHGASLCLFLSITHIRRTVEDLLEGGYEPDTPVVVAYRVSWPDEAFLRATLSTVVEKVKTAGFTRQALILVGEALDPALRNGKLSARSHLYDPAYTHRFRTAQPGITRNEDGEVRNEGKPSSIIASHTRANAHTHPPTHPYTHTPIHSHISQSTAILARSRPGMQLAVRLSRAMPGSTLLIPEKLQDETSPDDAVTYSGSVLDLIEREFYRYRRWIFCLPMGIAVRALSRVAEDKRTDPAVVVVEETGQYAISVLSGHLGGADKLSREVAAITGGKAVITGGAEAAGVPAPDALAERYGWVIGNPDRLLEVTAAMVNGDPVTIYQDSGARDWWPDDRSLPLHVRRVPSLESVSPAETLLAITCLSLDRIPVAIRSRTLMIHPKTLAVGIGCERGVSEAEIREAVTATLSQAGLTREAVGSLASIDLKSDEAGLVEFARSSGLPLHFYSAGDLNAVEGVERNLVVFRAVGAWGVAEPAAVLAADGGSLRVRKAVCGRVTVAMAQKGAN